VISLWHRILTMRSGVPRFFAWVLAVTALFSAVASIGFAFGVRTQPMRAVIDALFLPAPANLAYAVFLGMLAAGVNNRKWVAFQLLVGFFVVEAIGDCFMVADRLTYRRIPIRWWEGQQRLSWLVPHLTIGNLAITALILVVLIGSYGEFTAKVQRASLTYAVATFTVLTGVFSLGGWALVEAFPGSLRGSSDRLVWTIERILGGAFTFDVTRSGRAPGWLNLVLGFLGAVTLLASAWVLLRSQLAAAALDPGEERRIRQLLAADGDRDSLGYFATRRDKLAIFAPSGRAAVTYRVVAGVTLASGDPIGDPDAWDRAIGAWMAQAREYAWTPAVMGASEAGATAFARAGLRVIEIGDEAFLHADAFALDGPDMRQVRQAVQRVHRAGTDPIGGTRRSTRPR
jgi:lysyl-tRNA synthetase class 2